MAHTTRTSDVCGQWVRETMPRNVPKVWFGQYAPDRVTHIEVYRDFLNYHLMVRWKALDDPEIHSMPFEQTDEGVMAVMAAMKLTC